MLIQWLGFDMCTTRSWVQILSSHNVSVMNLHDVSSGKANEQGICYINVKFRNLPKLITEFMVYIPEMLTQLEEENLQERILATIVEVENALVWPQKIQVI